VNGIFRYYSQPIRIVVTDRAGIGILVAVPGARLPGLRGQRLPRQPHPRPGVVELEAELIQAQVLIPLFARKGVVVDVTATDIVMMASSDGPDTRRIYAHTFNSSTLHRFPFTTFRDPQPDHSPNVDRRTPTGQETLDLLFRRGYPPGITIQH